MWNKSSDLLSSSDSKAFLLCFAILKANAFLNLFHYHAWQELFESSM